MEDVVEAEVVEGHGEELVPAGPAIATVQVTPEEAKEQNQRIEAVIKNVLQEGATKDYWKIPGTPQPTLLQPGAEALQRFFGLGRQLSDPILGAITIEGKDFFSCQIKCSITNQAGRILSEAFGYCDDTETQRSGGPGSKWKGKRHTIIQMATKRAYVAAIKNATGTSNFFTADMEDDAPRQQQAAPVADRMSALMERNALVELYAQKSGKGMTDAKEWLEGRKEKGDSYRWVAETALALLLKPDAPRGRVPLDEKENLKAMKEEVEGDAATPF